MSESPAVFFSYARADDESEKGRLSGVREALETELRTLSGEDWNVFQDVEDIKVGQQWKKRLDEEVSGSTFFVAILTPRYLKRPICRDELSQFLRREKELSRDDLVLPILYLDTPTLEDVDLRNSDQLVATLVSRQFDDWRELRIHSLKSAKVRKRLTALAGAILASHRRVPSPVVKPPPAPAIGELPLASVGAGSTNPDSQIDRTRSGPVLSRSTAPPTKSGAAAAAGVVIARAA